MRATTDSMLEALQEEEHRATLRMHELEQILSDGSGSIVKRSKAQVELSQLEKKFPHLVVGHGEAKTQSRSSSAVASADASTVYDEEAPPTIPQDQPMSSAGAGDGPRTTSDAPASTPSTIGLERGLEIIDDEEAPPLDPHLAQASSVTPKKEKMKGSIEQSPDSDAGPMRGAQAASAHDVSLTQKMKQTDEISHVKLSTIDDSTVPNSDELAALSHDDSLDKSKAKQRMMNTNNDELDRIHEADLDRDSDAQPIFRDANSLPPIFLRHSTKSQEGVDSTQGHEHDENLITANVQTMSPYINESDEICIPTATAVDNDKIPAAEVIHPDKYSLTIAGRKIHLRFLALGALIVLGAIVALAVTLSKKTVVQPSSAPSVSMVPSLTPSSQPSMSPTSTLQAELVDIISGHPEGSNLTSFSYDMRSGTHSQALSWLVNDQAKWRAEKELLSNAEVVERFVLALLYFDTNGNDWSEQWDFINKTLHVCLWRDYFKDPDTKQRGRKGVIRCDHKTSGRIQDLNLWNNGLLGSLPAEIGLLTELTSLHIHENRLYGNLPDTLGDLANIANLELNGNDFTGEIDSLSRLKKLQHVDLSKNKLSGSVVDPFNLTELQSFIASSNKFSGPVPEAFSDISSLETLRLDFNDISGNVDFMCNDLPDDFSLDCYGRKPEIECSCCFGCTFVSDEECDLSKEKMLSLKVFAGDHSDGFEWKLIDSNSNDVITAGGEYEDGEELNIQLCLPYPRTYTISLMTPPTPSPTSFPTMTQFPSLSPKPTTYPTTTAYPTSAYNSSPDPTPDVSVEATEPATPSTVCGDFAAKKECIKSAGGKCDWDANDNICVEIVTPLITLIPTNARLPTYSPTNSQSPTEAPTVTNRPTNSHTPTEAPTTLEPTVRYTGARISFSIDGYSSSIDSQNQRETFYVTPSPSQLPSESPTNSASPSRSAIPSFAPTSSVQPTSSSRPSAPTPYPTPTLTEAGTHTVGTDKTLAPTYSVTRPPPCHISVFKLSLRTDDFGMDTTWKIIDRDSGTTIISRDGFPSNETIEFNEYLSAIDCDAEHRCYDFVIEDYWDDGICCEQGQGNYSVWWDDVLIGSGGEFGASETLQLGCVGNTPFPTEGPWPTHSPTTSSKPTTTVRPTSSPTASSAPTQSAAPSNTARPTPSPASSTTPVARDDTFTMPLSDGLGFIPVLDNDTPAAGQSLSVVRITTQATNGECILDLDYTNVVYIPDDVGSDSCVYEACDTVPNCDAATVTITVTAESTPGPWPTYSATQSAAPASDFTFICPNASFIGCTAVDPSNPIDECPSVGEPCLNSHHGEYCCRDACPRNYCTGKQAPQ